MKMNAHYSLRQASSNDAAAVAALGLKVWLHTYTPDGLTFKVARYALKKFSLPAVRKILTDPNAYVPVIEHKARIVAYAVLKSKSPCPAAKSLKVELSTLYVQEQNAGHGLGSMLLSACQREAAARGLPKTIWLRVNSKNSRALQFYKRHKFKKIGSVWVEFDGEKNENYLLALQGAA